MNEKVKTKMH